MRETGSLISGRFDDILTMIFSVFILSDMENNGILEEIKNILPHQVQRAQVR